MPLPIRDGNQSLTTLSTLLVGNAHIPAHTVVSLGSQAITDIAGAVSGVELGPNTINALENIHVSISAGSSITVGNVVSVTGGLTNAELRASSVTIGGSVSVSNFPATQAVTFGQASVTFGVSTITGSVSILNLPATPSVTFTQASVTFGQAVVSASNIGNLNDSVGTDGGTPTSTKFIKIGGHQDGSNQVEHIVHVSSGGAMKVDATDSSITFGAITGSVSVLNLPATQTVTFTQASVTFSSVSISNFPSTQTIAGTVTANVAAGYVENEINSALFGSDQLITNLSALSLQNNVPISGTVTVGNSVTVAGTVQANGYNYDEGFNEPFPIRNDGNDQKYIAIGPSNPNTPQTSKPIPVINESGGLLAISGTVTVGNSVTVAGTVTANVPLSTDSYAQETGIRVVGAGYQGAIRISGISPLNGLQENIEEGGGIPIFAVNQQNGGTLAVSGTVTVGNSVTVAGTVTANPTGTQTIAGTVTANGPTPITAGYGWDSSFSGFPILFPTGNYAEAGFETLGSFFNNLNEQDDGVPIKGNVLNPIPISGTVTVSSLPASTVTVSSLPAISGTVTANVATANTVDILGGATNIYTARGFVIAAGDDLDTAVPLKTDGYRNLNVKVNAGSVTIGSLPAISGTVTANVDCNFIFNHANGFLVESGGIPPSKTGVAIGFGASGNSESLLVSDVNPFPVTGNISGTVTVSSLPASTVTVSSLPAISGTVTANVSNITDFATEIGINAQPNNGVQLGFYSESLIEYRGVSEVNGLPISGTVTASAPNGSLTTRFGTPVTANSAFATSAVTNANRKYLLIQNVTTGGNVITVGIGFTPTTTQGIQLTAGAGITFESSYIPTGAVYVLSSVTASNFTILEA